MKLWTNWRLPLQSSFTFWNLNFWLKWKTSFHLKKKKRLLPLNIPLICLHTARWEQVVYLAMIFCVLPSWVKTASSYKTGVRSIPHNYAGYMHIQKLLFLEKKFFKYFSENLYNSFAWNIPLHRMTLSDKAVSLVELQCNKMYVLMIL